MGQGAYKEIGLKISYHEHLIPSDKSSFFFQIHGSLRKVDRCYSERTDPWGLGQPLVGLSDGELRHEIQERVAENPMAYRENINPYSM